MKICTNVSCVQQNPQPLINFWKHNKNKDGLNVWCKFCSSAHTKKWRANNKSLSNKLSLDYYNRNKEKVKDRCKSYYANNVSKVKAYRLKKKYSISIEEYNSLLEKQNSVCAVCIKPETAKDGKSQKIRDLAVDHCHSTGKVRGLLCGKCNQLIGLALNDKNILLSAAKYL